MAFDQQDLLFEIGAAGALTAEPGGEVGVARVHDALLDEVEHVLDRAFDARALSPERPELRLALAHSGRAIVQQIDEQCAEAFGTEQALSHGIDDDRLKRLIAHTDAGAGGLAATQAP